MINVLLLDDHASFRQALTLVCDREPDISVVGQGGSLAEGRRLLSEITAALDVVVLDLDLPDGNGRDFLSDLGAARSAASVLVLTGSTNRVDAARAVESGASGVLSKLSGIEEIIDAIRRLGQGEHLLSPRDFKELLRIANEDRDTSMEAHRRLSELTMREREVLQALSDGLSDRQISDRLNITPDTARKHVVNILGKLAVSSRLQAVLFAARNGAVQLR